MAIGILGIGFGGTPIGQRIEVLTLSEDGTELVSIAKMDLASEDGGRYRSLVQGPDGSLYAAVDEGVIYKITP